MGFTFRPHCKSTKKGKAPASPPPTEESATPDTTSAITSPSSCDIPTPSPKRKKRRLTTLLTDLTDLIRLFKPRKKRKTAVRTPPSTPRTASSTDISFTCRKASAIERKLQGLSPEELWGIELRLTKSLSPLARDGFLRFANDVADEVEAEDGPSEYWRREEYRGRMCKVTPEYSLASSARSTPRGASPSKGKGKRKEGDFGLGLTSYAADGPARPARWDLDLDVGPDLMEAFYGGGRERERADALAALEGRDNCVVGRRQRQ